MKTTNVATKLENNSGNARYRLLPTINFFYSSASGADEILDKLKELEENGEIEGIYTILR